MTIAAASSARLAIVFNESDYGRYADALDVDHALTAHAAFRRFGKGRHPAGLNMGDCFSYATARLANAPLLFKGNDFTQTDLAAVL